MAINLEGLRVLGCTLKLCGVKVRSGKRVI